MSDTTQPDRPDTREARDSIAMAACHQVGVLMQALQREAEAQQQRQTGGMECLTLSVAIRTGELVGAIARILDPVCEREEDFADLRLVVLGHVAGA